MSSKNVRRDNDPSFPYNDDVTRDEFDEHEAEFEEWKSHIAPMFEARLLAVAAALMAGNGRAKEFYEATLYEAFSWLQETPPPSVDKRSVQPGGSREP